ncbi:transaldolase [Lactovum odontotermitis]
MAQFKVALYSDGAVLPDMVAMKEKGYVTGFTTNPSLMKAAGVTDYIGFAKEALAALPGMPISFEVFADNLPDMEKEAVKIASLGENVYVKIPIMTTDETSTLPLIKTLSAKGLKLNITALMTEEQVAGAVEALAPGTDNLISIFVGRIADVGRDPIPLVKRTVELCKSKPGTKSLWASTREFYNILQADEYGIDVITVPPTVLEKFKNFGRSSYDLSHDTVLAFKKDIDSLGLSIL